MGINIGGGMEGFSEGRGFASGKVQINVEEISGYIWNQYAKAQLMSQ